MNADGANGGLFVHSRAHGKQRGHFYACTSSHLRGRQVCENRQLLPMDLTNTSVLDTLRSDLLDPRVIERALCKPEAPLDASPDDSSVSRPESERQRLEQEIARLTGAIAAGGNLAPLLAALQEREQRPEVIGAEIQQARADAGALVMPLNVVMPEVRRRLGDWQGILCEESTQARQMLRALLRRRRVFTPDLEYHACDYGGEGDLSEVLRGLVSVPKVYGVPNGNRTPVVLGPRPRGLARRVTHVPARPDCRSSQENVSKRLAWDSVRGL